MPEKIAFIYVTVLEREGRFYATSKDVPGLYICGTALADVQADIGPMIERMYMLNKGLRVKAAPAVDPESFAVLAANDHNMQYWAAPLEQRAA